MIKNRSKIKTKIKHANSVNRTKHCVKVFRSNLYTTVLLVDNFGKVLTSFSSKSEKGTKSERAFEIGKKMGKYIVDQKIKEVFFNRSGYIYHGRVRKVAEGIRDAGGKI